MFEATTPADCRWTVRAADSIGGVDFCRDADFCGPLRGIYRFPQFRMETKQRPAPAKEVKTRLPTDERHAADQRLPHRRRVGQRFQPDYNGRTFYSVSFSRSYKSASGDWRYTKNFDREDLGKIVTLCQQAAEYIDRIAGDGQAKRA